ncbi:hypothetical protein KL86PLE_120050 [uncultured Pleomorphomonas sp.]|uniref:Uncharacterized protein n=1 Tax=uncultured Pleomorphomonas sp. TaxID=442121 RepID=A0A212L8A4_9HYPH|nr:hypothetical protein [uncultured Pleomorphomonas sp.]SCM73707.1 hypothetical protein KL86PLE_120050 [uncultured Pleomorphomonas sp.]
MAAATYTTFMDAIETRASAAGGADSVWKATSRLPAGYSSPEKICMRFMREMGAGRQ